MELNQDLSSSSVNIQQPKANWKKYIVVVLLALANAMISMYLYVVIGSLIYPGENAIALIAMPIQAAFLDLPQLAYPFLFFELIVSGLLVVGLLWLRKVDKKVLYAVIPIFFLVQYLYLALPNLVSQSKYNAENPINTESQSYDFSKPVLINSRKSIKNSIQVEDNNVVWWEADSGESQDRVPKVFAFTFDSTNSQGKVRQLSGGKGTGNANVDYFSINEGNVKLFGNNGFWTEQGQVKKFNLEFGKQEDLVGGVTWIAGDRNGSLLIEKGATYYDTENVHLYSVDLKTGAVNPINVDIKSLFGRVYNGDFVCYQQRSTLGRVNLSTGINETFKSPILGGHYDPHISQCEEGFMVYAVSPQEDNFGKSIEWYKYDFQTKQNVQLKRLPSFSGTFEEFEGYLFGNKFYYLAEGKISELDLAAGSERTVVEGDIDEWDIDGDSIVYSASTSDGIQYSNHLYLKILK